MRLIEPYTSLQKSVLVMVLLNALSVPIMLSSVNVALPYIAADLKLSALSVSWIPTAFLMASAMFILVFGRLADMFGRKKVFLIGATSVSRSSPRATPKTPPSYTRTSCIVPPIQTLFYAETA